MLYSQLSVPLFTERVDIIIRSVETRKPLPVLSWRLILLLHSTADAFPKRREGSGSLIRLSVTPSLAKVVGLRFADVKSGGLPVEKYISHC